MPRPIDPLWVAAIRQEYVTSAERPSLRDLVAKYGISLKTISRRSVADGWATLRDMHWRQATTGVAEARADDARIMAETDQEARQEATEKLRRVRDALAETFDKAIEEIRVRWGEAAARDLLRFIGQAPGGMVLVDKHLELLAGRPTDRHEIKGPPIELTLEEEEMLDELWARVRAVT